MTQSRYFFFLPCGLICLGQIVIILSYLKIFNVTYKHAATYVFPIILN